METVTSSLRVRSQRGSELLEMALVLPMLLLIIAAMFDFGFMFREWEIITNAAREGARIAVLPDYTTADVEARVTSYLDASGFPGAHTTAVDTVSLDTGGPTISAKQVTVATSYSFLYLGVIGGLFGGTYTSVPLTGVATMRSETAAAP